MPCNLVHARAPKRMLWVSCRVHVRCLALTQSTGVCPAACGRAGTQQRELPGARRAAALAQHERARHAGPALVRARGRQRALALAHRDVHVDLRPARARGPALAALRGPGRAHRPWARREAHGRVAWVAICVRSAARGRSAGAPGRPRRARRRPRQAPLWPCGSRPTAGHRAPWRAHGAGSRCRSITQHSSWHLRCAWPAPMLHEQRFVLWPSKRPPGSAVRTMCMALPPSAEAQEARSARCHALAHRSFLSCAESMSSTSGSKEGSSGRRLSSAMYASSWTVILA